MGPLTKLKAIWALNKLANAWQKTVWRTSRMNWKTYTSAAIVAVCGALQYLQANGHCDGCDKVADALLYLAGVLGLVGLRHAIAKSSKVLVLAALLAGGTANAQAVIDVEAGGALAPSRTPRASGYFAFCAGGEATRTCSIVDARPISPEGVTYSFTQRVERSIVSDERLEVLGFADFGVATSEDATAGIFKTGGALKIPIRGPLFAVTSGGFERSPLSGNEGWAAVGVRYRFGRAPETSGNISSGGTE